MKQDDESLEWRHCNQCLGRTRHEVVATRSSTNIEDIENIGQVDWVTSYTMLECRGCGSVTLRVRSVCDDLGVDQISFYPPSISRRWPKWCNDLPGDFFLLLVEVYKALHANSRRLALMGTRALVDLFINETIGDIGGFDKKLARL